MSEDITIAPTDKIFQEKALWVGTFIGGPLVTGYMIAENFKVFNEPEKAKKTWIVTLMFAITLFWLLSLIPDSIKFPNNIVPIINIAIAYFLVQRFQKANIISHTSKGGLVHTWKRAICVSLIGLFVTLMVIFIVVFMSEI
ncbi:MAG TPA: hypothetical protein VF691_20960 [Cytophagaceae bacterium]